MKYFIGNIFALIVASGAIIWPLWLIESLHLIGKIALSLLAVVFVAFFVERLASKWVNKFVSWLIPDK